MTVAGIGAITSSLFKTSRPSISGGITDFVSGRGSNGTVKYRTFNKFNMLGVRSARYADCRASASDEYACALSLS